MKSDVSKEIQANRGLSEAVCNVIFCPPSKLFFGPLISIRRFYKEKREQCFIAISDNMLNTAAGIFDGFIGEHSVLESVSDHGQINLVFYHHGSRHWYEFFCERTNAFIETFGPDRVSVSFFPDGFTNGMTGRSYAVQFSQDFGRSVNERDYLTFEFQHKRTLELARRATLQQVRMSNFIQELEENKVVERMVNIEAFSFLQDHYVIILPFRPWCSRGFHGGNYNFGSKEELLRLYRALIESAIKDANGLPCILLFRPDDRYVSICNFMINNLVQSINCINMDHLYPQVLTLEPLIYYAARRRFLKNSAMICLDSTSFQMIPFLIASFSDASMFGFVGAPEQMVRGMTNSEKFIEKPFKLKINELLHWNKAMNEAGLINCITEVDRTFFVSKAGL